MKIEPKVTNCHVFSWIFYQLKVLLIFHPYFSIDFQTSDLLVISLDLENEL